MGGHRLKTDNVENSMKRCLEKLGADFYEMGTDKTAPLTT
jgi:hypothetical protein